jgi:hypothetical protein
MPVCAFAALELGLTLRGEADGVAIFSGKRTQLFRIYIARA